MRRATSPERRIEAAVMRQRKAADSRLYKRAVTMGCEAEWIDRAVIRERDNRTCYLCGKWVDVADMTLDHVIPLSRGGAHRTDNVRLAHHNCNSKKGNRLLSELDLSTF